MGMLTVSASPHIRAAQNTQGVMLDVIIALLPAAIAGIIIFGINALFIILTSIISAVLSEFIFDKIVKKRNTITDLSAVVTGLLLALNLSTNIPLWQVAIGSCFAIVVVKCLFGGIGQNFANPAITARVFMLISFSDMAQSAFPTIVDSVATATPLAIASGVSEGTLPSLLDMFLGLRGGCLGETSALALIIGGAYLMIKRVISWHTPVSFILVSFICSWIFLGDLNGALYQVMGGGLLIGAIFMATDYATTPVTKKGKFVFGVCCGLITTVIRIWGSSPEGVSYAILLMNILTPYVEKFTAKKPFGGVEA
ncbi:MAG: RnfABCDGE type electron transport complex subunit D [Ruminococcaceae bacterium]|nr:RnfABCDGE type electron transport complex subunit D [Oscillospiraceae bacterium]